MQRTNTPTTSRPGRQSARSARTASSRRASTPGSRATARRAGMPTTTPTGTCMSVSRDGVSANTHRLNILPDDAPAPQHPGRVPLYEVYMRMAEELAKRSTCSRLQVGTVVTDQTLENVLDRKSTRLNSSH